MQTGTKDRAGHPSKSLGPVDLAIDAAGNIWIPLAPVSGGTSTVVEFNNQGVPLSSAMTASNNYAGGYTLTGTLTSMALDLTGNAWFGTTNSFVEKSGSGTTLKTISAASGPAKIAFDYSGNLWAPTRNCCYPMYEYTHFNRHADRVQLL